jgi:site-specific DNA recombinase
MFRAAIYARYSTEHQRDASIEDQVRLCRERIEREAWTAVQTYSDRALSGASLLRPGLQRLIEDAMTGKIDVVVAEALDRLSRDQADVASLFKRLTFAGVRIVTLAEGDVSELHIGLKGTMNQLFLKDLADKTRRGLRGRVEAGRSGGGNAYGYSVVQGATGERQVEQDQARIVLRIFQDYARGLSPRTIARALNRESVPGPRSSAWTASTIHGNHARGTGILNNELYIGRLVWNRLRYVKDPATGRRVSRHNPPSAWVTTEVPELRIVPQELWEKVKARQGASALPRGVNRGQSLSRTNRPRYLFSRLVTCGVCGGGMSMISATHVGCSAARNSGTCGNTKAIARTALENRVLTALSTRLMDPALFSIFCAEYAAEANRRRKDARSEMSAREQELARVTAELKRLVQAIADGMSVRTIQERLEELEARRTELETELSAPEPPAPILHPCMSEVYRKRVTELAEALQTSDARTEAAEILRSLIERIELRPTSDGYDILLRGDLGGILRLSANSKKPAAVSGDGLSQVALVAGA